MERWQLQQLQGLPLEIKIQKSLLRIQEWYEHWNGNVYVSFSGGKDSVVLLHLVRSLYPNVVGIFSDTGLEFPEIKEFIRTFENIEWIKPEMKFTEVIAQYGWPVISKEIAYTIYYARAKSQWAEDRLNGIKKWGNHKKYKYLLDAPFKISSKCCDKLKKEPFKKYEKKSGFKPFIGSMASEGGQRDSAYLRVGCNAFESKRAISTPLGFWKESDVWEYIHKFNIPYCKIYDMGYHRTGCMFCMFGCNQEKEPNRFQRMAITHPKSYDYCMNKLGMAEILDFIGVNYKPVEQISIECFMQSGKEKTKDGMQ